MNGGERHLVGDLMFTQEGAPQAHQSVLKISRNTGIFWSSDGRIIHDLFRATHPEENNATGVANVFSGSVATQIR